MNADLDGSYHIPGTTKGPLPSPEVTDFLKRHPQARIIVVVDTHCIQETGGFLWYGSEPKSFQSCTLYDVNRPDLIDSR